MIKISEVKMKKSLPQKFNRRAREYKWRISTVYHFGIVDFKEGIDLFDVKYVHIFELSNRSF